MIACIEPDCRRAPQGSPTGAVYAMCPEHTCSALTAAFGAPETRSWHGRSRAHTLPTSIVGGISIARSDAPVGGAAPTSPQPVGSASLQVAALAAAAGTAG